MKRLTMSLDDELADAFEALVRARGYENRSEAFRDLLRQDLGNARLTQAPAGPCVATLSYIYNHHQRQLAARLNDLQHDHHELTVSTMHAHLDHEHCMETVILRGRSDDVKSFAQTVIAQPGVSHGHLHVVPAATRHLHGHDHLEPATAHPGRSSAGKRRAPDRPRERRSTPLRDRRDRGQRTRCALQADMCGRHRRRPMPSPRA